MEEKSIEVKETLCETKESILDKQTNNLITIEELFKGDYFYRIPEYQRGYSWNKEFDDLWKDIQKVYNINSSRTSESSKYYHYTGMLTFEKIDNLSNENLDGKTAFYIVDGQQRLTSIVIIINSILNRLSDKIQSEYKGLLKKMEAGEPVYRLLNSKSKTADFDFLEKHVYKKEQIEIVDNQYQYNIKYVIASIDEKLKNLTEDELKDYLTIILQNLKFNIYFVEEGFDVRVTFETMNNRGKPLTNLELLKNRLMYLTRFFDFDPKYKRVSNSLKENIEKKWKNIYSNLSFNLEKFDTTEKFKTNKIKEQDDDFLRAHWILYGHLDKTRKNKYIESLLNETFSIDNPKGEFSKYIENLKSGIEDEENPITKYIESLERYSRYWKIIHKCEMKSSGREEKLLKNLSRLPAIFYLKVAVLGIAASSLNEEQKISIYEKLENFVFINKLIAQDRNDMSYLVTAIKQFIENDNFDVAWKNFETVLAEKRKTLQSAIDDFVKHINDSANYFYDWNGIRYLLYRYEEEKEPSTEKENNLWNQGRNFSIEHILPQKGAKNAYWRLAFGDKVDDKKVINAIGNLIPLKQGSENSTVSNYSYPTKIGRNSEDKQFTYIHGTGIARSIANKFKHWQLKNVYERSSKMLDWICENWFEGQWKVTDKEWIDIRAKLIGFEVNGYEVTDEDLEKEYENIKDTEKGSQNKELDKKSITYKGYTLSHNEKKLAYLKNQIKYRFKKEDGKIQSIIFGILENESRYWIYLSIKDKKIEAKKLADGGKVENIKVEKLVDKIEEFLKDLIEYVCKNYGIVQEELEIIKFEEKSKE